MNLLRIWALDVLTARAITTAAVYFALGVVSTLGLHAPTHAGLIEIAKLTASDAAAFDRFGSSVDVSGGIALVGAIGDNPSGLNSGSAYVFNRNEGGPGNWGQIAKLTASDGSTLDKFGVSVGLERNTAIIGAKGRNIGGNLDAGAAYIYQRNFGGPNNWGEVVRLTASDGDASDNFGHAVDVYGTLAVVGAVGDNLGANSPDTGSAYLFEQNFGGSNNWGQVAKLTGSDGAATDGFGFSVALDDDVAIVGAKGADNGGQDIGSAYIFERNQGGASNWGQSAKLTADDGTSFDEFGFHVAISDNIAIVGARGDNLGSADVGSAYIFERDHGGPNNWGQVTKLFASDGAENDQFGFSVAISHDLAVVGAYSDNGGSINEGSAYVFRRDAGGPDNWGEIAKLTASDAGLLDEFGFDVNIDGSHIIVGALDDNAGTIDTGSAYVYAVPEPPSILLAILGVFGLRLVGKRKKVLNKSLKKG